MSKIIFKMTFKHPNFKTTSSKNVAHVNYIATRPGVDMTVTEKDLQKELDKGIDSVMEEQIEEDRIAVNSPDYSSMSHEDVNEYLADHDIQIYHVTTHKAALMNEGNPQRTIGELMENQGHDQLTGTFDLKEAQRLAKELQGDVVAIKVKAGAARSEGKEITFREKDILNVEEVPEKDAAENWDYLKYIDERPRSHGLFGQDGIEDIKAVQDEIENCPGFVWRAIVSLKEEDAKGLDYLSKEKWQDLLREKMPDVALEMGIRLENLRWVGAIHMERGHPHAHVMIWEKDPEKTVGIIHSEKLDNIRKIFTDRVFEEEREKLLLEKNAMRDLILDLAKGDISQGERLLQEVHETGLELKAIFSQGIYEGIPPKIYDHDEQAIAEKLSHLAELLPGKGRVAFKFMPEEVKNEVRAIADYVLSRHEFSASLAQNLKAVEELTRLYTGKEDAIQKAREHALNDIRDRICNIILRGAVESLQGNLFYVDQNRANKAIEVLQGVSAQIDLYPERLKVLSHVAFVLQRGGLDQDETVSKLMGFSDTYNLGFTQEGTQRLLKDIDTHAYDPQDIHSLSSFKKIEFYYTAFKLAGYNEKDAFSMVKSVIQQDNVDLKQELDKLSGTDYLKFENGCYKLTEKGIDEYLKAFTLDRTQKNILESLEGDGPTSFEDLLEDQELYGLLVDKDPEEFQLGKFDLKVREEFGDDNAITLDKLETNLYKRYTFAEKTDVEKAEKELDIFKQRINKLSINGYAILDKETGIYSFTEEAIQKLDNLKEKMEFTRYDANVTMGYIDQAPDGVLQSTDLDQKLHAEIANQTAQAAYDKFTALLNNIQTLKYIHVDHDGKIEATEEGKELSYELNQINSYFSKAKGTLTEDKLSKIMQDDYKKTMELINKLVSQEFMTFDGARFVLTEKGVDEYIKTQDLDAAQVEIIQCIQDGNNQNLDEMLNNDDVFSKLYNKDPDEFKMSRFDFKVKEEFGSANRLTFTELKAAIDERYNLELPEDVEKAQNEFDLLKGRIEKLALNGYLAYNPEQESYSFTKAALEELDGISKDLEFGRYDASTTMSYIDRAEDGILRLEDLRTTLERDVVNQTAKKCFESAGTILEDPEGKQYISIDDKGIIRATKEGKALSYDLRNTIKYFNMADGRLTEEKLFALCKKEFRNGNPEQEVKRILEDIERNVAAGNVTKDDDGNYQLEPLKADVSRLAYQIYKAGGAIPKDQLRQILDSQIPNNEAKKLFDYLHKRLEFLKDEGYVSGEPGEYQITLQGEEERKDILTPQRVYLKNELRYLVNLGFLEKTNSGYVPTAKYEEYLKNKENPDHEKTKGSYYINRQMSRMIAKSLDNIDLEKTQPTEKRIQAVINKIKVQVQKDNVLVHNDGSFTIDYLKGDIRSLIQQLHREGGSIHRDQLKEVLEKNIPNLDADRQYNYIIKRLDFLKEKGYLEGKDGEYVFTELGKDKRADLLMPQREYLRKELKYLTRLGLITKSLTGYIPTSKYFSYKKEVAAAKEEKVSRESHIFRMDIGRLIDKTTNRINVDKIQRVNTRVATGKYLNDDFDEKKTDYESVRSACNVPDTLAKTLNNVSTALLVAGKSLEEVKQFIHDWNARSNSSIDAAKLDDIIDKAHKTVEENKTWGKITVISKKDWDQMFKDLGVKDPPKWMYKGENWKSFGLGLASLIRDAWKAAWRELEKERMRTKAQAEMMKKQQIKQQAVSQNKSAQVEAHKKGKDKSSLSRDEDMQI